MEYAIPIGFAVVIALFVLVAIANAAKRQKHRARLYADARQFLELEVSVEGRQKSMVFEAANPLILATIIRICCQADDPLDLSQTTLNVTFVE